MGRREGKSSVAVSQESCGAGVNASRASLLVTSPPKLFAILFVTPIIPKQLSRPAVELGALCLGWRLANLRDHGASFEAAAD
jgi:hypothetical protein